MIISIGLKDSVGYQECGLASPHEARGRKRNLSGTFTDAAYSRAS